MYQIIDGLCFLSGIAGFVLTFVFKQPKYCPIPIIWIPLYPIIIQSIYNLLSKIPKKVNYDLKPTTSRIVYNKNYNITFCGIQKMHPFDSSKYGNTFSKLIQMGIIDQNQVIVPDIIPRSLLLQKMSAFYLLKLNYSIAVSKYVQLPIFFIPAFLLRWRVLNPMMLATQGTILSCIAATKLKWSVNLSGGYHHASCSQGGGFCIYPDITLAVHYLQTRMKMHKIMIIDLDAHQGNGHERDHLLRDDIFIVDAYNHAIYPNDRTATNAIAYDIVVNRATNDSVFLQEIQKIRQCIETFRPDFVIYNAGTDCLIGDPLGNLSITAQGIIKRDQTIIRMCLQNNVPVSMILSGGYQKINAQVIANSIRNLYSKFDSF